MRSHSWQKNAATREAEKCPEGEHKQETGRKMTEDRDCQKQTDGRKAAFLSKSLQNASHFGCNKGLVALPKLFPLGCSFCSKGTWLWDTAKTCYQRTGARITDANPDAGYQVNQVRHKPMQCRAAVRLREQSYRKWCDGSVTLSNQITNNLELDGGVWPVLRMAKDRLGSCV